MATIPSNTPVSSRIAGYLVRVLLSRYADWRLSRVASVLEPRFVQYMGKAQTVMKKPAREPRPRQCIGCNKVAGEGPLPFVWDVHQLVDRTLICSCSSACRRAMGYKERKVSA